MTETRLNRLWNTVERLAPPTFLIPATFLTMVAELHPLTVWDWLFIVLLECAVVLWLWRSNRLPRVLLAYCVVMGVAWVAIWVRPWTVGDAVATVVCFLFGYALLALAWANNEGNRPPPSWTLPRWSIPVGRVIFEGGALRIGQREFQPLIYVVLLTWFASVLMLDWLLP